MGINGLNDDPSLATVAGLVVGSVELDGFENERAGVVAGIFRKVFSKAQKMFKVFIP